MNFQLEYILPLFDMNANALFPTLTDSDSLSFVSQDKHHEKKSKHRRQSHSKSRDDQRSERKVSSNLNYVSKIILEILEHF